MLLDNNTIHLIYLRLQNLEQMVNSDTYSSYHDTYTFPSNISILLEGTDTARNDHINEDEEMTPNIDIEASEHEDEEMSEHEEEMSEHEDEEMSEHEDEEMSEYEDEEMSEYERIMTEINESDEENDDGEEASEENLDEKVIIDQPLNREQMPQSFGEFAPYFKNITESLLFCWMQKHRICKL